MTPQYCFGTAPDVAWFDVDFDGDRLPSWTAPELNAHTFVIPGSFPPRSETQIVSIGVSILTWRLWFPSQDRFWRMLAKLGTTGTLTVPANVQSHRGTYREEPGGGVVDLPGTLLLRLDADVIEPEGSVEAIGVFQRHIDPTTGLVVP